MRRPLTLLTLLAAATAALLYRRLTALSDEAEALRADLMETEMAGVDLALQGSDRSPIFVYRAGAHHPQGPYLVAEKAHRDAEALACQWPGVPVYVLSAESNVMTPMPEPFWEKS